jgi:hypothetical protein
MKTASPIWGFRPTLTLRCVKVLETCAGWLALAKFRNTDIQNLKQELYLLFRYFSLHARSISLLSKLLAIQIFVITLKFRCYSIIIFSTNWMIRFSSKIYFTYSYTYYDCKLMSLFYVLYMRNLLKCLYRYKEIQGSFPRSDNYIRFILCEGFTPRFGSIFLWKVSGHSLLFSWIKI